jgi:glycerate kinase
LTSVLIHNQTAYLEVATLAGLQLVKTKGDIFEVSSYAVGQAIKMCNSDHNIKHFVIGCGGSAFSDAGYGCMSALFDLPTLDKFSDVLKVDSIDLKQMQIESIVIPCDV